MKWDLYSTISQCKKNTPPEVRHLNISQKATIWPLELENVNSQ